MPQSHHWADLGGMHRETCQNVLCFWPCRGGERWSGQLLQCCHLLDQVLLLHLVMGNEFLPHLLLLLMLFCHLELLLHVYLLWKLGLVLLLLVALQQPFQNPFCLHICQAGGLFCWLLSIIQTLLAGPGRCPHSPPVVANPIMGCQIVGGFKNVFLTAEVAWI